MCLAREAVKESTAYVWFLGVSWSSNSDFCVLDTEHSHLLQSGTIVDLGKALYFFPFLFYSVRHYCHNKHFLILKV